MMPVLFRREGGDEHEGGRSSAGLNTLLGDGAGAGFGFWAGHEFGEQDHGYQRGGFHNTAAAGGVASLRMDVVTAAVVGAVLFGRLF